MPERLHLHVPDLPPPEAFVRAQLFFTTAIVLPPSSDRLLDQPPGVQFEISSCNLFLRALVYGLLQVKPVFALESPVQKT
jgi:hypothetical protein